MNENRAALVAFGANVVYFALAAAAGVYITAESWHYGFWFTPVPLLLTLLDLLFIGATILGLCCLSSGIGRYLGLGLLVSLLMTAGAAGSFFAPACEIEQMWTILLAIVGVEAVVLITGLDKALATFTDFHLSVAAQNAVRLAALLIPLPIIGFAALQTYVMAGSSCEQTNQQACGAFVQAENFAFGHKRCRHLQESFDCLHRQ